MRSKIKIFLFCISSIVFIGCDRATKDLAKEHLKNKEGVSYLHDTFRLEYAENTGAAMSFGDKLPKTASLLLFSVAPLILLSLLFLYALRHAGNFSYQKIFCIALIFAGGVGNIIDRILFDRHVPDFMIMQIQNFRTGIFNFADVCVTVGAIGLIVFFRDKNKKLIESKISIDK
jgi:signal peptidase II